MSQLPIVPPGIHLSAVATSNFTLESGIGAKSGRPWSKVVGRGVAGEQFVKVQQFMDPGETPVLVAAGEKFTASIVGVDFQEKGREVLSLMVKLNRPTLAVAEVKR
jgi:hypothetical protein